MNQNKVIMAADLCCGYVNKLHSHGQIQNMNPAEHAEFVQNLQTIIEEVANKKQVRLLICGGRDYKNATLVWKKLDELKPDVIINGGAKGADNLAKQWAETNGVACLTCYPAWSKFNDAAGPIRNQWMLDYAYPTKVLAFPGGKGTKNMIKLAKDANLEVEEITDEPIQPSRA